MVVQGDTAGPGIELYRSNRFEATLNGVAQYVYAHTRNAFFTTRDWVTGQSVELSMLKFGADEDTTVEISLADATPITSYTIYPPNVPVNPTIAGGNLTLTVPPSKTLVVEVNGNSADSLMIFANPPKPAVPAGTTDFTTLAKPITSVNTGTNEITFTSPHGLTTGQKLAFPIPSGGSLPAPLREGIPYTVTVVSPTVVTLSDWQGNAIDLTTAGSGSLVAYPNFYTNASSPLYFGPGRHVMGWGFTLGTNTHAYVDRGAVLLGGFRSYDIDGQRAYGAGFIDQSFETYEELTGFGWYDRAKRAAFDGGPDLDNRTTMSIEGLTVFACPFYFTTRGFWSAQDIQVVSPWTPNTDGFLIGRRLVSGNQHESFANRIFLYVGDDAIHAHGWGTNRSQYTGTNFHVHNTASASIHLGYEPFAVLHTERQTNLSEIDIVHRNLGTDPDDLYCHVVKGWMDGFNSQTLEGSYNINISNVRVWGEFNGQPFSIRNYSPGWDAGIRDQAGNIAFLEFDNWTFELNPLKKSIIEGRDQTNTPHDITFSNLTIGGVVVNESNYEDFFDINNFPYNIFWDAVVLPPSGPSPFGPEFTSTFLSELEAVNTMLTAIGASPVSSLNGVIGPDVAVAKHILTEVRRDVLLQGWAFNTEYEYPLTPGTDGRIRVPLGCLRIDTDPRRFPNIDPVQRGLYLYDRKNRTYTFGSAIRVEMIVDLPWDSLPEVARNYIAARAATIFIGRMDAGTERIRAAQQIEMMALTTMKQNETDVGDYTMISGPTGLEILYRGR